MTFYEIQQLLKKFGTYIYTGSRQGDIELMEEELTEMYRLGMIDEKILLDAKMALFKEKRLTEKN
ncbi:MAG: YqgQ family protein [Bacillus sp. (in: Bacteria)]|nr:YqgQ family protein [Bacillus sp. (in: firmicutes)]